MTLEPRAGAGELSRADADRLGAALEASIAPNTAKAYKAALRRFARWLDGRPATDVTVAAYVAALMDQGKAPATIRQAAAPRRARGRPPRTTGQAAAAIGAGARARGLDDPRGPLARQALAGAVRHNAGEGRGQVAGLRREDALAAAAAAAAQGTVSGLRDAALLRTMSDALLRASEVAAIDTRDVDREGDGSGRLAIRRSKTDQEGEGAVCYLTPATTVALDAWLAAAAAAWTSEGPHEGPMFRRGEGPRGGAGGRPAAAAWTSEGPYEGPMFRRVTRSGAVSGDAPLTTNAVRAIVRKRAEAVGVAGASGHSCRVGSAQSLIERGASTAAVAIAGRWKDPGMVVRYAKAQEAGRGAVRRYFGDGGK